MFDRSVRARIARCALLVGLASLSLLLVLGLVVAFAVHPLFGAAATLLSLGAAGIITWSLSTSL